MDKKRIRGRRQQASRLMTAKPISIKDAGCKSGGCARKAAEITSGDLLFVPNTGLRAEGSVLTGQQKSAEGMATWQQGKARTVPARG